MGHLILAAWQATLPCIARVNVDGNNGGVLSKVREKFLHAFDPPAGAEGEPPSFATETPYLVEYKEWAALAYPENLEGNRTPSTHFHESQSLAKVTW